MDSFVYLVNLVSVSSMNMIAVLFPLSILVVPSIFVVAIFDFCGERKRWRRLLKAVGLAAVVNLVPVFAFIGVRGLLWMVKP